MYLTKSFTIFICLFFIWGCSASYKQISNIEDKEPINFQDYLLNEYKKRATFEAEEMHDWNSAKLYSEKAIKSLVTDKIYPEEITYWKLPKESIEEISTAYDNLMTIYNKAKINDPYNLAKAISSLDCWLEQQEENWQTWDISRCKEDFLISMHNIYEKISTLEKNKITDNIENELHNTKKDEATIITKNKNDDLMQIIYFDFDQFTLSEVSKNKIKLFIKKYKNEINEYLIVGHADTMGSKNYNLSLSIERAKVVQETLVTFGIKKNIIKILGKGEESLAINTPDNTKHPGNRRVEIKKAN